VYTIDMKSVHTQKQVIKRTTIKKKKHRKSGFTLLEILISIGIMASLATFFLGNVGILENIEDTNDATAIAQETTMTNLLKHYAANEGFYPDSLTSTPQAICKAGSTGDCVNLSILIDERYAKSLPVVPGFEDNDTQTGLFAVVCNGNLLKVQAHEVPTCGVVTTPGDTTPPVLVSLTPDDNATGVEIATNLVLTFDEPVTLGAGTFSIWRTSDNSNLATIIANGPYVSGNGTTTITVNPASDLPFNTPVYVQFSTTAFADAAGNYHTGITNTTDWNFTTAAAVDVTPPTLVSTSPVDNATGVATTTNISFTFSEAIVAGAGTVRLYRTSDNALIWTLAANTATIVASTATFNPTIDMAASTSYYVLVDATAFTDLASNAYAGITSNTAYNFTTAASGPVCGNSAIEAPEQCDDGNTSNGDTCSSTCNNSSVSCIDGYFATSSGHHYANSSDCTNANGGFICIVATCFSGL
jgi:prepilin-type N-terminal cleavage/methylation domain-containing protein